MDQTATKFMKHSLWLYILGWGFFFYLFIRLLSFSSENQNDIFLSGLNFIDFGVHELSHLAVAVLPSIVVAAAGSVGEFAFPLTVLILTLRRKAYFAASFAALWVMLALHHIGTYMADATAQALTLVGPSENVKHDWNFVFGQLGWLRYDTAIGNTVYAIGTIVGVAGLVFGLFLIARKIYLDISNNSI